MKKIINILIAVALLAVAGPALFGCESSAVKQNPQSAGSKLFHKVPVPAGAESIKSKALVEQGGRWGAAYTSDMTMEEAAKWYEKKLAAAGFKFEKSPEKPADEGYTIFNMTKGNEALKVVIVNDGNKSGVNIQVTGEPAK